MPRKRQRKTRRTRRRTHRKRGGSGDNRIPPPAQVQGRCLAAAPAGGYPHHSFTYYSCPRCDGRNDAALEVIPIGRGACMGYGLGDNGCFNVDKVLSQPNALSVRNTAPPANSGCIADGAGGGGAGGGGAGGGGAGGGGAGGGGAGGGGGAVNKRGKGVRKVRIPRFRGKLRFRGGRKTKRRRKYRHRTKRRRPRRHR